MIPDLDIWRAASSMIKRYGAAATVQAATLADFLLAEGDLDGCATWNRIEKAIEELQTSKPAHARVN